MSVKVKRIAVFVSGHGTNMVNIVHYFDSTEVEVAVVVSDNAQCGAISKANELGIESHVFTKREIKEETNVVTFLQNKQIDFIVLAGFLGQIGSPLIAAYPERIVNIHPALLPKYGGKGMYGDYVHEAVLAAKERRSGITIHLVDEAYDHGTIICQTQCAVLSTDTPESLAQRIHRLEYLYYPLVIKDLLGRIDE